MWRSSAEKTRTLPTKLHHLQDQHLQLVLRYRILQTRKGNGQHSKAKSSRLQCPVRPTTTSLLWQLGEEDLHYSSPCRNSFRQTHQWGCDSESVKQTAMEEVGRNRRLLSPPRPHRSPRTWTCQSHQTWRGLQPAKHKSKLRKSLQRSRQSRICKRVRLYEWGTPACCRSPSSWCTQPWASRP
jgi:hypothetical protein